jgi:hypothetical protein
MYAGIAQKSPRDAAGSRIEYERIQCVKRVPQTGEDYPAGDEKPRGFFSE